MLNLKLLSPLYLAVIECEPAESNEVVKIDWPEFTVFIPICVFPSMKVTVPEGFFIPCDVAPTVAINVIGWPNVYSLAVGLLDRPDTFQWIFGDMSEIVSFLYCIFLVWSMVTSKLL
jgi:hypothetical protein